MATTPHPPDNQGDGGLRYAPEQLTTVSYRKRQLVMYPVQKHEFDILTSGYSSAHLGLFTGFLGAAFTLGATIASVPLPEPTGTRFWNGFIIVSAFTVYFCAMSVRDWFRARAVISTIKSETVDVVVTQEKKST